MILWLVSNQIQVTSSSSPPDCTIWRRCLVKLSPRLQRAMFKSLPTRPPCQVYHSHSPPRAVTVLLMCNTGLEYQKTANELPKTRSRDPIVRVTWPKSGGHVTSSYISWVSGPHTVPWWQALLIHTALRPNAGPHFSLRLVDVRSRD